MKKFMIPFTLFLLASAALYASGDKESWASIGGELNRATENSTVYGADVTTTLNSVGFFLKSYDFDLNKNTGLFVHDSFLIPTGGKIESMGTSIDYSYSDTDSKSYFGIILGPAYKTELCEFANAYLGFGPSMHLLRISEYPNTMVSYMIGLGVDVGIHIMSTDNHFLNLGVLVDYNFANYTNLNDSGSWASDYSLTSISPYVGVGLVL